MLEWFWVSQCISECFSYLFRETKEIVYGNTSWDISQLGQYIKAKRYVKPWAWRLLQDMVEPDFIRLLLSLGWNRSGCWYLYWRRLLLCLVSSFLILFLVWFSGSSTCRLRYISLRRASVLSPSESLREADVKLSSSGRMEMILQYLPFDLDFFESHCSSCARSGCIHMISPVSNVKGTRPLLSWVLTAECVTSSRGTGTG